MDGSVGGIAITVNMILDPYFTILRGLDMDGSVGGIAITVNMILDPYFNLSTPIVDPYCRPLFW